MSKTIIQTQYGYISHRDTTDTFVRLVKPDVFNMLIEGREADKNRLERIIGHLIDSYGNE